MKKSFFRIDDRTVHTGNEAFIFGCLRPVGRWILQTDLGTVQKEVQFFGRIVAYLFIQVEKTAVSIAYPSPATLAEGDVVDGIFIVQTLVEVNQLVDVELANLAQTGTARTTAFRMIE